MLDALLMRIKTNAGHIARAVTIAVATLGSVNMAMADDFHIQYDQAKLMRIVRPAHSIIVGNPSIADVSIQGKQLLVVTGKSFGITNLIVLDENGAVVIDRKLIVQGDDQRFVNLQKGHVRQSYNCTPTCQAALVVGDNAEFGAEIGKAIQQKAAVSAGSSGGTGGN